MLRWMIGVVLIGLLATSATAGKRLRTISRDPYVGAMVVDASSGRVLFHERADAQAYPASITKLMTLLVTLDAIKAGTVSLTDRAKASRLAATQEPSSVGLLAGQSMTVRDLLYAIMVKSANDAAVVLAEHVAGSTEAFVARMNARAKMLEMKNTHYGTVNGLPPRKGQTVDTSTARDLSKLAMVLCRMPEALEYTAAATRTVTAGDGKSITLSSHNYFLRRTPLKGCDGLKTGYTHAAGSSIALTAKRDDRRVIVIVLGSARRAMRDDAARRLMENAFSAVTW